jgi:hypothetical protein
METIEINFKYRGALVDATIQPEENYNGLTYRVDLNQQYAFTLYSNDKDEWEIMRENNATVPYVEEELLNKILVNLKRQLKYAA